MTLWATSWLVRERRVLGMVNGQMLKPTVSVCIPTCQAAAFIHQAIESVLIQSFTDFELLIVDDNSIDGSGSAADSYMPQKDRRNLSCRHFKS